MQGEVNQEESEQNEVDGIIQLVGFNSLRRPLASPGLTDNYWHWLIQKTGL